MAKGKKRVDPKAGNEEQGEAGPSNPSRAKKRARQETIDLRDRNEQEDIAVGLHHAISIVSY